MPNEFRAPIVILLMFAPGSIFRRVYKYATFAFTAKPDWLHSLWHSQRLSPTRLASMRNQQIRTGVLWAMALLTNIAVVFVRVYLRSMDFPHYQSQ